MLEEAIAQLIARLIGKERPVIGLPTRLAYQATRMVGLFVDDVFLTWEEVQGLMAGALAVYAPPAGKTALTDWVRTHADTLGRNYTRELARRRDRRGEYRSNQD